MFSDISSASYQAFTFSFMSERPAKSSALNTSCSVNPKQSAYSPSMRKTALTNFPILSYHFL